MDCTYASTYGTHMAQRAHSQGLEYRAQKITVELIRRVASAAAPPVPREILDSSAGLILRHQPSGFVGLYVLLGRGKRERPFGKRCDARRVIDPSSVLTLAMVKAEAKRLRGDDAGGRDFKAERGAARAVPTLRAYLTDTYGPWVKQNRRSGQGTLDRIEACFLDDYGDDKIDTLTPAKIEPWKTRRRKAVKAETLNRDLDDLRSALTRAVRLEILAKNPLLGVEREEVDRHKQEVRALDADEKAKLIDALKARDDKKRVARVNANEWRAKRKYDPKPPIGKFADVLTPAVVTSLETGLRRRELLALEWPNVDFKQKELRVRGKTAKTFETRDVPLNERVRAMLRDWWLQSGQPKTGLVFAFHGERIDNLKRSYHAVLKAAEIPRVNAKGERVNWHSLRHTFGSLLGAANVDPVTLMKLMGHANLATTQRYLHTDSDRKRAAVDKLA